jgi:lactate racemase
VFHIEMTVNNDTFPGYLGYMQTQEATWSAFDRISARANQSFLSVSPLALNRKIFFANKAPYKVTSIQAGEAEAVHKVTLENVYRQQLIGVQGQADIVIAPIPYVMPYSVHSIMNPILVFAMGLGYMFNFYKNHPVLKKGGTMIFLHPLENKFHEVHHPSYIELFEKLKQTREPYEVDRRWADYFAHDPRYIERYRFHNAYHGFHAISMWNWGSHGMTHTGQVISVNPTSPEAARQLGWETAPTLDQAIEMGRARQGRSASITVLHNPPIAMWDVQL